MFKGLTPAKKALKIIVVGCGKVGATIIEQLAKEGNDLVIIDQDRKRVTELSSYYDVMGIVGNGASYSILKEAGIDDADLIIAVTGSDELNLLCCTVAKRVGNTPAIARVRTPDYMGEINFIKSRLGLALVINPDMECATEISRILCFPKALEVNDFSSGNAELIKIKIPEGNILEGMSLADFGKNKTDNVIICAIERNGEVKIPAGTDVIEAGDVVTFVAARKTARSFMGHIGFKNEKIRSAMIIGGGKTSFYLAKRLLSMNINVKIIERDLARCEELSILLPKAIVINGDGTDEELLHEEGIESVDAFIPLTGIDEQNILLTLNAQKISDTKAITKIARNSFKQVIAGLDLGSVVYPRQITSESIITYVRARRASIDSNVETVYHMFDDRAEAIEFLIGPKCTIVDTPIKDLHLKPDLQITSITREGRLIIPGGDDTLQVGDVVVVVTTISGLGNIQEIIA